MRGESRKTSKKIGPRPSPPLRTILFCNNTTSKKTIPSSDMSHYNAVRLGRGGGGNPLSKKKTKLLSADVAYDVINHF